MDFRIADTFTDGLARLNRDEQKAVKTTAFDLQLNPADPGMSFHKLDKARDKNFWSIRVSRDIRLIVHRTQQSLLLCYVGHHDDAYRWAERRKIETHPATGAAQIVEVRERIEEIAIPKYVDVEQSTPTKPPLFAGIVDGDLLAYGVPEEWLADVRRANEDTLLDLTDHLPAEAAEALLELATGGHPEPAVATTEESSPFEHPDAQRRFRVMNNIEELERALEYPWERWSIFLHPAQRQLVERDYNGPARVAGSAGTGKTVVALHRAVYLARTNPDARVLLTTFSDTLASVLRLRLRRLIGKEPRLGERVDVHSLNAIGERLYELQFGRSQIASREQIRQLLAEGASAEAAERFSLHFLTSEWEEVVDSWQLNTWESFRDVRRLGRKTRLPERQREVLWGVFERVRDGLRAKELMTRAGMFARVTAQLLERGQSPFDFAVVDEAQDLSVPQLRFLAALGGERANSLFFAGDLGQRIFQIPFSWKSLDVDVRGRSRTLHINYRTSHQIRAQADRLLDPEITDVDGVMEERRGTVSVFNGPPPDIRVLDNTEHEVEAVDHWLKQRIAEGVQAREVAVFVRSQSELDRAIRAVDMAGLESKVLDEHMEPSTGRVSVSTMYLAKGLEFRAVAVMACDDEVIPSQTRIVAVADTADLEEIYNTERHLLYVACTRARDHLLVTGADPASEFLDDLAAN